MFSSPLEHCGRSELSYKPHALLQTYDVSENGFLPKEIPLARLPDPLYTPWEDVMLRLPELLKRNTIRQSIEGLDVLSTERLRTDEEWRRAYVILSFLAHGYIWGGDMASEVLPPAISVPYLSVSRHLHLPPVATYAALNLWNFTTTSGGSTSFSVLDNLKALHTFSGTEDESWFYCLSAAMECQGAQIIPVMLDALGAIRRCDYGMIADSLDELRVCIEQMGDLLGRMHEKCDPMVFYHQIRPYLAGSKGMEHAGLPNGVFYDVGSGKGNWMQFRGGSNGQSSLIQFLDVILGVEHASPANGSGYEHGNGSRNAVGQSACDVHTSTGMDHKKASSFHVEVRSYMPEPHRRFLEDVSRMDSLKDLARQSATSDEQRRMQRSFQAATAALAEFRSKHMQMVTRYIVVPSRRQQRGDTAVRNLASASLSTPTSQKQTTGLTGTGGTDLIPFLRQTREETLLAGRIPTEAVR